jgi:hypothetical protein
MRGTIYRVVLHYLFICVFGLRVKYAGYGLIAQAGPNRLPILAFDAAYHNINENEAAIFIFRAEQAAWGLNDNFVLSKLAHADKSGPNSAQTG